MGYSVTVITHELQEDTLRRFLATFPNKHEAIDYLWQDEPAGVGFIYGMLTDTFEAAPGLKPDGESELIFDLRPTGEVFSGSYWGRVKNDRVEEVGGTLSNSCDSSTLASSPASTNSPPELPETRLAFSTRMPRPGSNPACRGSTGGRQCPR